MSYPVFIGDFRIYYVTNRDEYYISYNNYYSENLIAKEVDIALEMYLKVAVEQYNARCTLDGVYFKNAKDPEDFIEWLQSLIMAKKLNGEDYV